MKDAPPFLITPKILNAVGRISELVGAMGAMGLVMPPMLRWQNRIKSITGTLAIEGNTMSEEQVTAVLEGKRVMGTPKELAEVRGAIQAYEQMLEWNSFSLQDLLNAHAVMMAEVLKQPGVLRRGGVGIQKGDQVLHIAPPADRVRGLLNDLLQWVEVSEFHPLITSSVFHYEFEFIHPFADGNGRLGRLWQTRMLAEWSPLFVSLPLESVIRDHQQAYYDALSAADQASDSTGFVSFMLRVIEEVLIQQASTTQEKTQETTQEKILRLLRNRPKSTRKELAVAVGITPDGVKYHLDKLRKAGTIRHVGPTKAGHWEVTE